MNALALTFVHLETTAGGGLRIEVARSTSEGPIESHELAHADREDAARLVFEKSAGTALVVRDRARFLRRLAISARRLDEVVVLELELLLHLLAPERVVASRDDVRTLRAEWARASLEVLHLADSERLEVARDLEDARSPLAVVFAGEGRGGAVVVGSASLADGPARGEPAPVLARIEDSELHAVFGAGGTLARAIPGYAPREAQFALARVAAAALNDGRVAMVEAGAGVGKTFGYLVPMVLHAARNQQPVVLSTKTKNLQAQLFERDLPVILGALGMRLRAVLVKGRADYLCRHRVDVLVDAARRSGDPEERIASLYLSRFAGASRDGDLERVSSWAIDRLPRLRRFLDAVRSEHGASGRTCPYGGACFYPRLIHAARAAHLLVVNHALALRWPRDLPRADAIVFDEAHHLIDAGTSALTVAISRRDLIGRLRRIEGGGVGRIGIAVHLRRAGRLAGGVPPAIVDEIDACLDESDRALEDVREVDAAIDGIGRIDGAAAAAGDRAPRVATVDVGAGRSVPAELTSALRRSLDRLDSVARRLTLAANATIAFADDLGGVDGERAALMELALELESAGTAIADARDAIVSFLDSDQDVRWIELDVGRDRGWRLARAPLDVGAALAERLYSRPRSVVLTSATLRIGDRFDYLAHHLGFDAVPADRAMGPIALGSPLPTRHRLRFFVPRGDPSPLAADEETACRAVARFVFPPAVLLGGRTLVLFNALSRMTRVAALLRVPLARRGIDVLCPGDDGPAARLLERFRDAPRAVLLGGRAFFEGVDAPHGGIRCVVIERIPFDRPDEPIHAARVRAVEAAGGDGFLDFSLPRAELLLRQAGGRIVRGAGDGGVVLILDPRAGEPRRYGPSVRRALPAPCDVGDEREILERALVALAPYRVSEAETPRDLILQSESQFLRSPSRRVVIRASESDSIAQDDP